MSDHPSRFAETLRQAVEAGLVKINYTAGHGAFTFELFGDASPAVLLTASMDLAKSVLVPLGFSDANGWCLPDVEGEMRLGSIESAAVDLLRHAELANSFLQGAQPIAAIDLQMLVETLAQASFQAGYLRAMVGVIQDGTTQHAATKRRNKRQNKAAAVERHSKPGASRDRRRSIQDVWAGGTYASRDECAEQECAHLGMSYSSARKALRNTPDPSPWPANK